MVWYYARRRDEEADKIPVVFPLLKEIQTPSQKATIKYFWVVSALLLVQVVMGVVTAHYGVEGQAFYGSYFLDCNLVACNRIILCSGNIGH